MAGYTLGKTVGTVEDAAFLQDVVVFPNPAQDVLYVVGDFYNIEDLHMELFDLQGRLVHEQVFVPQHTKKGTVEMTLPQGLPLGTYTIRLLTSSGARAFWVLRN